MPSGAFSCLRASERGLFLVLAKKLSIFYCSVPLDNRAFQDFVVLFCITCLFCITFFVI